MGADGSIAAGQETGKATLALRRTLTLAQRKRGVLDAMAYAASVGVTTHLDQGAFQATDTPSDGAAHEDNYTMHLPFLERTRKERALVRLRINFLHMDTDPALPGLTERLRNAFPFFGNDMVRTGGIGEFIAAGLGPTWLEAARRVAQAGWRAEVHSLVGDRLPHRDRGLRDGQRRVPDQRPAVGGRPRPVRSPRTTSTGSRRSAAASASPAGATWPAPERRPDRRSG